MFTNKSPLFRNILLFSVLFTLLIPSVYTGEALSTNHYSNISTSEISISPYPSQSKEDDLFTDELQESSDLISTASRKKWTIMTYMDGDNNLEGAAIDDIDEMELGGGSTDDINVIVQIDRIGGFDTSNGDWTGAKIYNIVDDVTRDIDSSQLVDLGEVAMDDPATLQNFIEYCFVNFPADYYCLNLWDHGAGIFGACFDDTSVGGGGLTINEIQTAIVAATTSYSEYIDIVSFDCCLMTVLELAYELRDVCDYLVASEDLIPWDGYDYEPLISKLISDPDMTPEDFCKMVVKQYGVQYISEEATCLSAIDLSKIGPIMTHLNDLATNLSFGLQNYNYKYQLYQVRSACRAFSGGSLVDIVDFCLKINNIIINKKIETVTSALKEAVEDAVLSNWQHSSYSGSAHGLTIFYPITDYQLPENVMYNYANRTSIFTGMDFQQDNSWGEFIRLCYDIYSLIPPEFPDFINLDTSIQNTITENYIDSYLLSIQKGTVYELSCTVESGDVDIYLSKPTANGHSIISGSSLINPDDGSIELCRNYLQAAMYTVIVFGVAQNSQYSFDINTYTIPTLDVKDQQNTTGGSVYGEDEHFIQDLHHYYTVELKKDIYNIILNNSATTNYMINIYSLDWELLDNLSPAGYGNGLHLLFNCSEKITIIIEVFAYEGVGSFELVVLSTKGLGFSLVTALLLSITAIFTISYIRYDKKRKRN